MEGGRGGSEAGKGRKPVRGSQSSPLPWWATGGQSHWGIWGATLEGKKLEYLYINSGWFLQEGHSCLGIPWVPSTYMAAVVEGDLWLAEKALRQRHVDKGD